MPRRSRARRGRQEPEGGGHVQHAAALRNGNASVPGAGIAEGVLVEQRHVLAHPDGVEAHALDAPAEVADHLRRRQGRHERGEHADLHGRAPHGSIRTLTVPRRANRARTVSPGFGRSAPEMVPRHHDVPGLQREPAGAQVVGEPGQRVEGVAHDLRPRVGSDDLAIVLDHDLLPGEVQVRRRRDSSPQHDRAGHDTVGDEIGRPGLPGEHEIRQLERGDHTFHGRAGGSGGDSRADEPRPHHEGHLGFDHQTSEVTGGHVRTAGVAPRREEARRRLRHAHHGLAGRAGGAELPADRRSPRRSSSIRRASWIA